MAYRILFVLTQALHPNNGGVQMSTCKLGRALTALGYEVGVFSFASAGHSDSEPMQLFSPSENAPDNRKEKLRLLERTLKDFKPDAVINQMPYEHDIGDVLKKRKRYLLLGCLRNTLYSVRGNLAAFVSTTAPPPLKYLSEWRPIQKVFLAVHRRRHRAELLRILDTYDHFVMFGPPNLDELRYFVPEFRDEQIRLIPNSIPEVLDSVPPKERRLLWLGRIAHVQKRADLILPVWEIVSQALPEWSFDVVGDGPLLGYLREQARTMGLERISFHGRQVPDQFYRRASIFCMTSAFEGFPNTLVEAQSFGAIPVVFDSYPVATWIMGGGLHDHLVEPFDVEAMAQSIVKVATDPQIELRAEKALESARRFHIDLIGKMWQRLLETEVPKHVKVGGPGLVTTV